MSYLDATWGSLRYAVLESRDNIIITREKMFRVMAIIMQETTTTNTTTRKPPMKVLIMSYALH